MNSTKEWNRDALPRESAAKPPSPALYLSLTAAVSFLAAAAGAGIWHLVSPRLAACHPSVVASLRYALAAAVGVWGVCIVLEALSLRLQRDILRAVPAGARRALFGMLYPLCRAAGILAGRSTDAVAASYIAFSNGLVMRAGEKGVRGLLLVLLPRCLQREGCARAVTEDVKNCRACGNCDLAELVPLMERHGFTMAVATGGGLARAMVRDLKPAGVIAVACERELLEGLREIGGVPIICITNRRPEGPCRNTQVDIEEFKAAVRRLTG
ncbi:MAG: DUF116 domain-containing protein [Chlamydiota bacterium]